MKEFIGERIDFKQINELRYNYDGCDEFILLSERASEFNNTSAVVKGIEIKDDQTFFIFEDFDLHELDEIEIYEDDWNPAKENPPPLVKFKDSKLYVNKVQNAKFYGEPLFYDYFGKLVVKLEDYYVLFNDQLKFVFVKDAYKITDNVYGYSETDISLSLKDISLLVAELKIWEM